MLAARFSPGKLDQQAVLSDENVMSIQFEGIWLPPQQGDDLLAVSVHAVPRTVSVVQCIYL